MGVQYLKIRILQKTSHIGRTAGGNPVKEEVAAVDDEMIDSSNG